LDLYKRKERIQGKLRLDAPAAPVMINTYQSTVSENVILVI